MSRQSWIALCAALVVGGTSGPVAADPGEITVQSPGATLTEADSGRTFYRFGDETPFRVVLVGALSQFWVTCFGSDEIVIIQ